MLLCKKNSHRPDHINKTNTGKESTIKQSEYKYAVRTFRDLKYFEM